MLQKSFSSVLYIKYNPKKQSDMRLLLALFAILITTPLFAQESQLPHMFAHRGCWSKAPSGEFDIPENSVAAVTAAARMGYEGIECDVHYTKDKKMVILHDETLNRTMRRASDYSKLEKPIRLADITFEELRRDYVLESVNPALRTPIPTLEELLVECKKQGIVPMLHSDLWESYEMAQEMFGDGWICFTGGIAHMQKVRAFSGCMIMLAINSGTAEENIANLRKIGGKCGVSTMNYKLYTPEFCKAITDAGFDVQASIFPAPQEAIGQRNGITYQLTDFSFMPPAGAKPKYSYKIGMNKLSIALMALNKKNRKYPQEKVFEYGGYTLEIVTRDKCSGSVKATLDGKEYDFKTLNKERIYIGKRFMNRKALTANINSSARSINSRKKTNIKSVRISIYEM